MRFINKQEFIERFLHDQKERKSVPKKKRSQCNISFKEETYINIMNFLHQEYGDTAKITKENGITIRKDNAIFSIKVTAKRNRVEI